MLSLTTAHDLGGFEPGLCDFDLDALDALDDFSGFVFDDCSDDSALIVSSSSCDSTRRFKKQSTRVTKSGCRRGAKIGQKLVKVKSGAQFPNFHTPELDAMSLVSAPNMSRRTKDLTLYAFPNFNKCDALLYFPSTLARHLNSADFSSLSELLDSHLHKNCKIQIMCDNITCLNSSKFMDLFELANQMHPDSILCMHTTKVVDNEIISKLYFKFTDNKIIYESLARTVTDKAFASLFVPNRSEHLKLKFNVEARSEIEQIKYCTMLDSGVDVVIYGCLDLRLSFDEVTKEIVNLKFITELTSMVESTL